MSASPMQRVAFVEIPDDAIDVLSHLTGKEEVDPAVLISSSSESAACRMADLLMVPTLGEIDPSVLQSCDLVVVGSSDPDLLEAVSQAVAGTQAVIRQATEVLAEMGTEPSSRIEEYVAGSLGAMPQEAPSGEPAGSGFDLLVGGGIEGMPADPPPQLQPMEVVEPVGIGEEIPTSEPEEEARLEPEADLRSSGTPSRSFALADLFGGKNAGASDLAIDGNAPGLLALLERAVRTTHASTGSIMLPEPGGSHLRIVAAQGLKAELIEKTRPAVGEGVAGEAFARGEPRMVQVTVPSFAEGDELVRIAAGVPILVAGKPVGVVSVNIDTNSTLEETQVFEPLSRVAEEAPAEILAAIDYVGLGMETKKRLVLSKVDGILAHDASFPGRLREIADVLQPVCGADFHHLFLVDPIEYRLQLTTPAKGLASDTQPVDRGFLAWVVRDRRPHVLWAEEDTAGQARGLAFLPVCTHRPYGLLLLENLRVPAEQKNDMTGLLGDVAQQIVGTLEIEQGVGSQDVLSELNMRIADRAGQIDLLPADLRTAPWLEFAIRILAAEAAIWVPEPGGHPTVAQPQTRQAASILAQSWDRLEELATCTREKGTVASGARGLGWDLAGPEAPAPWIGVKATDGAGVLLLFFRDEGDGESGPPAQIPVRILSDALLGIANRIEHPSPQEVESVDHDESIVPMLTREEFLTALHEEWERALAAKTSLGVTRVRPEPGASEEQVAGLRGFLSRNRRTSDRVAEVAPGVFLFLTKDPHDDEGLQRRIERAWQELHPEVPLLVESIGAGDVEGENALQGWLLEDGEREAA